MKAITTVSTALLCAAFALPAITSAQSTGAQAADTTSKAGKQESRASRHVADAVRVAHKLEADTRMRPYLRSAKGVFIVPSYSRAALGAGGAGGAGVLLVHRGDGTWSDPVFYNIGGLSFGLQAGVERGAFALVLNNDKAVQEFLKKNNFSLDAQAGITVVNWNKMAQATGGTGDVIAWADTTGLFGDLVTLELNNIRFNQQLTNAYYHRTLSASDVIAAKESNPQAQPLVQAVAGTADAAR